MIVPITYVSMARESQLARRVTVDRIVEETPDLRGLLTKPRKFFTDSIKGIRGKNKRAAAIASLIVWVRWGNMLDKVIKTDPTGKVGSRVRRARKCVPASVTTNRRRHWLCDCWLCPTCWYHHVRDRVSSVKHVVNWNNLGSVTYLRGIVRENSKQIPSADEHSAAYGLATRVRRAVSPSGSLVAARLDGHPGSWCLSIEMLLSGVSAATVWHTASKKNYSDAVWTVAPVKSSSKRGSELEEAVASCLEYPCGIFRGLKPHDMLDLFASERMTRSRVTGTFQVRM